ncbi:efflux RND transporter periplasmic adaptor subunit [Candidatus Parcubacteria bacterium]|nr:MAG: efflux RND transporter periplasmic adaptor subunit [Candidatus Parcubacteria bacterium]
MKKKIIITILALILVGSGGAIWLKQKKSSRPQYEIFTVSPQSLTQTVSETGVVKSTRDFNLSFLRGGRVSKVLVEVGDKVKAEQILAELDYQDLLIKQRQARAQLEIAQANLNKLLAGATAAEIAVQEAQVQKAKVAYDSAVINLEKMRRSVEEKIKQAQKTYDDLTKEGEDNLTPAEQEVVVAEINLTNTKTTYAKAKQDKITNALTAIETELSNINTALDAMNTILTDQDLEDVLSVQNSSYLKLTQNDYQASLVALNDAQAALTKARNDSSEEEVLTALQAALSALNQTFSALTNCYKALENTIPSSQVSQTTIDTHKTTISTHLTTISASISSIQTARQNLEDAILNYNSQVALAEERLTKAQAALENAIINARHALSSAQVEGEKQIASAEAQVNDALEAYNLAKAQLNKIKAPARPQDVALARAQVKQAQSEIESIQKQIDDSILRAPVEGTITQVEVEAGEQVSPNQPIITLLEEGNFRLEVDIAEADIAKIKMGDKAQVTFDALGPDYVMPAEVVFIDPAETVIQDVTYYKVKLKFNLPPEKLSPIKPGMTANIDIQTAQKDNVLAVPARSVIEKGGKRVVRLLKDGQMVEQEVQTGIFGDRGMVEIISGLQAGDQVVTYIK